MCEPTTAMALIGTGLSIGQSVMGYQAQGQQAKQQNQTYQTNYQNAMKAFEADNAAITNRQIEEQSASAQKKFQMQQQFDAAKGSAVTAAGEAGVSGLSVDAILNDLGSQQDQRMDATTQNTGLALDQLQRSRDGIATNTDNRVNSVQRGVKPNPLALALQIGGNVISGYNSYQTGQNTIARSGNKRTLD